MVVHVCIIVCLNRFQNVSASWLFIAIKRQWCLECILWIEGFAKTKGFLLCSDLQPSNLPHHRGSGILRGWNGLIFNGSVNLIFCEFSRSAMKSTKLWSARVQTSQICHYQVSISRISLPFKKMKLLRSDVKSFHSLRRRRHHRLRYSSLVGFHCTDRPDIQQHWNILMTNIYTIKVLWINSKMYSHYNFKFHFTQSAEFIKNSQWGFNIRFWKFF